jgi:hypothetical protein
MPVWRVACLQAQWAVGRMGPTLRVQNRRMSLASVANFRRAVFTAEERFRLQVLSSRSERPSTVKRLGNSSPQVTKSYYVLPISQH